MTEKMSNLVSVKSLHTSQVSVTGLSGVSEICITNKFLFFSMKKIIFVSLLTLSLYSLAYTSEDVSNANYLADQKIVTKQTTGTGYRLDDKILRQEVIGMALKIKGVALPENYTCKKYFADATKNDWVCRAVELAADNGIITRSNKYANPGKSITRAETISMIYNAS
jgi:hypothetical protein